MTLKWIAPLVFMAIFGFSNLTFARVLTVEEKVSDFEQTVSMIKAGYGPLVFKKRNHEVRYRQACK